MNSHWMRAGLAGLLLSLIGLAAWKSLPHHPDPFSPAELARNRHFLFWAVPDRVAPDATFENDAVRLSPGGSLGYGVPGREDLLKGSFQASGPAPAAIELAIIDAAGKREVLLRRILASAAEGRRFFVVDPRMLPSGTRDIEVGVAADSPGAANFGAIHSLSRNGSLLLSALPLPLLATEGLAEPFGEGATIFNHAPSQFLFALPAGPSRFDFTGGFNPAVFRQPENASDGIRLQVLLETGNEPRLLWQQSLDPRQAAGRELQTAAVELDNPRLARLRLVIDSGPQNHTAWDWAVWRDLRLTRRGAP